MALRAMKSRRRLWSIPKLQPEPSSHHCAEHGVVHRGQLTPVELKLSVPLYHMVGRYFV